MKSPELPLGLQQVHIPLLPPQPWAKLLPGPPHPTGRTACIVPHNDGNSISRHCTSNTSLTSLQKSMAASRTCCEPAFILDGEPSPGAAFRTFPGPKSSSLGLCVEVGADLCHPRPCHGEHGRSGICSELQMCHGSRGRCGCLWPPASFPSSQAKSRACYQEQKMCHLCCISFPFLHLFPARCAPEITALGAEAGERGRQRPRQPYRRLAGRKEIRKFAEIFGQQNKHFCCQKPNGQPCEPAAICTAPWLQLSGALCPLSPLSVCPCLACASSGDRDPSTAPPAMHSRCSTHSAPKGWPCAVPAVFLAQGQVLGWAGGCGCSTVLGERGGE